MNETTTTPLLQPTPEFAATSASPGHTIGPFFHGALGWAGAGGSADDPSHGPIRIEGTIEDGRASACPPGWSRPGCRRRWPPSATPGSPHRACGG